MKVEQMINYGNGMIETHSSPEFKRNMREMAMPIISVIYKRTGLLGILKMLFLLPFEEQKMRKHNWSKVEQRVPKKVFELTFQPIALMKLLSSLAGMEQAQKIITEIYEKAEEKLKKKNSKVNIFLIPVRDLKACEDSFSCFKEYTKASVNAGVREKLHESEIVEDTNDNFGFDIKSCAAYEVAKEYGNPGWCFPWCELDEVVYPRAGIELGFKYKRSSSLPKGASKCDFRYERI